MFSPVCTLRTVDVTVFGLEDGAFTDPDVLADEIRALVSNGRIDQFCVQVRRGDSNMQGYLMHMDYTHSHCILCFGWHPYHIYPH